MTKIEVGKNYYFKIKNAEYETVIIKILEIKSIQPKTAKVEVIHSNSKDFHVGLIGNAIIDYSIGEEYIKQIKLSL